MAGSKRAIIVGIPGVGKTTVINRAAELLSSQQKVRIAVFGTLMFEEAQKRGLKTRDELRKLEVEEQRRLQDSAAKAISEMQEDVVIVDTHLFINTAEGYYPGLPAHLLSIMKPTNLVLVAAEPHEIAGRRQTDQTRNRDAASHEQIRAELEISRAMLAACSVSTGAPFAIVLNTEGGMEHAAAHVAKILGASK